MIRPPRPVIQQISEGDGCYWARLSGFGGTINHIIANDFRGSGRARVTIRRSDAGFTSSGCGTWTRQQRWPECDGAINIDPVTDTPGAYAQLQLERERALRQLKRRALLPLWVGVGVLVMALMFFALQGLGTGITSIGAVVAGVFFALTVFRLALESVAWTKALEGGRRTAAYLEPLLGRGFVVLHNRQIPGRSNLARLLLDRPRVLNDEDVQQLARVADERLRPTYAWERGQALNRQGPPKRAP